MNSEDKRLDFSKGRHREMLEWQRRRMWSDEAIARLAKWIGLRHGMSLLDVGCGLGYLGYTFWNHFGKGGRYIGVDIRPKLIEEAVETSEKWAQRGDTDFLEADVYELPFDDNSFDWVACQTLMIHLAQPEAALHEMFRVLKPGGIITCFEPDNLRPTLTKAASSLPPLDLEQQLLGYRVNYIANQGRIKLGRGDNGIAPMLPHLMALAGVKDIDIRVRDTVTFMEPSYETERQREAVINMKKHWVSEENFRARLKQHREEFLAGGGDPDDFEEMMKTEDQLREIQSRQLEDGTFFICGAYPLYVITGHKPA